MKRTDRTNGTMFAGPRMLSEAAFTTPQGNVIEALQQNGGARRRGVRLRLAR